MAISMLINNAPHGNPHTEGNQRVADVVFAWTQTSDTYTTGGMADVAPAVAALTGISWIDRIEILSLQNGRQMAGTVNGDRLTIQVVWGQSTQKLLLYYPGTYNTVENSGTAWAEVANGQVIGRAGGFGTLNISMRVYGKRANV